MDDEEQYSELEDDEQPLPEQDEPEVDEFSPEFVARLIGQCLTFTEAFTGVSFHAYQLPLARRITESILINDGAEVTALASRQSGKSEVIANIVAALMVLLPKLAVLYPDLLGKFKDGLWVGLFAPVETQAETVYGRVVSRLTSPRALEIMGDPEIDDMATRNPGVTKGTRLKNSGSFVMMMTANPRAKIESKTFHVIIIDECFPYETPVLTSEGWVPIGDIVTGPRRDWVVATQAPDGVGWADVVAGYRTPRHTRLVRVDHEHGSVYATENHPFVVGDADVSAVSLRPGQVLSLVRGSDQPPHADPAPQADHGSLHQGVLVGDGSRAPRGARDARPGGASGPLQAGDPQPQGRGPHAKSQPDALGGDAREDVPDPGEDWAPPQGAGREWARDDRATAEAYGRAVRGVGGRACRTYWRTDQGGTPDPLQDRRGEPGAEDRGGDRRPLAWVAAPAGGRREEDPVAEESRVVGVQVLEPGSAEFDQFGDRADYVYTLEVASESHTYFAGGVLVGNCQEADDFVVAKCYAEDTPVWLPDGTTAPIRDVVEYRLPVLTYSKEWDLKERTGGQPRRGERLDTDPGELVGATPIEFHDNGVRDVWRVQTATGRYVDVTENHQWVVRERAGNRRPKLRETKDLIVGMQVPLPEEVPFFGDHGTFESGYFLGQMLGDGCMTSRSPMWCGYAGRVLDRMERFASQFGVSFTAKGLAIPGAFLNGAFTKGTPGPGNLLLQFLITEGVWGHKGAEKAVQRNDYSRDAVLGLLSGLIDSDGHVSAHDISFSNISERLVRQVSDMALKFGAVGYLSVRPNTGYGGGSANPLWTVRFKGRDAVLRLSGLRLAEPVKADRLQKLVVKKSAVAGRRSPATVRRGALGAVQWDRVVSVTPRGPQRTYCVTVDPSHLLVVNGLISRQSIMPMGAYYNATKVKTGTPTTSKNNFYKSIQLNRRMQTGRGKRQNHFQWDWKEVAKVNKNYEKFVRGEMLRLGEDSDEFLMSYCCRWLLERGMFVTSQTLDDLGDTSQELVRAWHQSPVIVGVDPARKVDSTVVTVVWVDWDRPDEYGYYDHRILNWLELQGDDWEEQYFQIVNFLAQYDVLAVGVDSGGVGDAVAGRLARLMPRSEIVPVGSSPSEQSKRWKHLQALLQRKLVGWPAHAKTRRLRTWKRFRQQMEDAEKNFVGPNMLVAAPDEAHAHDDFVDSLAIACSLTLDLVMPTVEQGVNVFYEGSSRR